MIQALIFDFNRTIYLPEHDTIPGSTIRMLHRLKSRGYILILVSLREPGRDHLIEEYGLDSLFSIIRLVDEKTPEVFLEVISSLGLGRDSVIVIGDRIRSEIAIAGRLGIRSIWFRAGRFSRELPRNNVEKPDWTVRCMDGVRDAVLRATSEKLSRALGLR